MVLKKDFFFLFLREEKEIKEKKKPNNQTETRSKTWIFLEPSREDPSQQGFPRSVHTDNSTGLGFGSHGKPAAELLRSCQKQQHPLPASFPPRQQSPRAANMAWNRRIPPFSDPRALPERPRALGSPQPHTLLAPLLGVPLGQTQNTPHKQKPPPQLSTALASPAAILTLSAGLLTSPGAPGHLHQAPCPS